MSSTDASPDSPPEGMPNDAPAADPTTALALDELGRESFAELQVSRYAAQANPEAVADPEEETSEETSKKS